MGSVFGIRLHGQQRSSHRRRRSDRQPAVERAEGHLQLLWTTYDLPKDIERIGGGANCVIQPKRQHRTGGNGNLVEQVPGYMTFDAMLKVPVTGKINVQLNLYNILDQNYIDEVHPEHNSIPGAGRTLLVSTNLILGADSLVCCGASLTSPSPEQVKQARQILGATEWVDNRKVTAGYQSARAKDNMQIPENHPAARQVGELILNALGKNPLFRSAALPLRVFRRSLTATRVVSRSTVTSLTRSVQSRARRCTSEPMCRRRYSFRSRTSTMEELCIEDAWRAKREAASGSWCYPTTQSTFCKPVTRGARLASLFWTQSMIQDDGQRTLLFDLDTEIQEFPKTILTIHRAFI